MKFERQVYLLDPQEMDPETIAVTFAKTSRSPQSFREIAAELTSEKSAEFHEKWVVGYGHASVAEHAVLHIAIENISRLAVETLESNRLASYTEKSTRYQKWDPDHFYHPEELENHPLMDEYIKTCRQFFEAYQHALPIIKNTVCIENPRQTGESEAAWERRIRSDYTDAARFYLPAASLANVGMTINARALEHALRKMLSHPLQEVINTGLEIKKMALKSVPTLVKYVDRVEYLVQAQKNLEIEAAPLGVSGPPEEWCKLIGFDREAEDQTLAAALYRFGDNDYAKYFQFIRQASPETRNRLAEQILGRIEPFDIPIRELEHTRFTFDLLLDQGGYFELKRHRMMTQTPQRLSARHGYAIPTLITRSGLEKHFRISMELAQQMYEKLAKFNPEVASYIVPNAFNRRVLLTMNLRSARHLIQLRTAPNAHFSIRRATSRLAEEIMACTPLFSRLLFGNNVPDWRVLEKTFFTQTS